jgi:hypothetical protein
MHKPNCSHHCFFSWKWMHKAVTLPHHGSVGQWAVLRSLQLFFFCQWRNSAYKKNSVVLSPLANYTDRAIAPVSEASANFSG